ncbi:hypothetical protein BJY01DRAFT_249003 [Aspergillus pseudoustus]|uniref:Carboxylesterase type B domain-containing protein n=1 Tax=Aspergillus pseudoustus TaxID=1810923 RepID=A0ABR4JSC8_9EURO
MAPMATFAFKFLQTLIVVIPVQIKVATFHNLLIDRLWVQRANKYADCLFLDVQVPAKVLKNKKGKAPVIVVIHGGGYNRGSKGSESGLLDASGVISGTHSDAIMVTINYRDRPGVIMSDYRFVITSFAFANAYPGKSYASIYSTTGALHASDVEVPYYWAERPPITNIDPRLTLAYQSYFHSQMLINKPNTLRNKSTAPVWPAFQATIRSKFLNVTDEGFMITSSPRSVSLVEFWTDIFVNLEGRFPLKTAGKEQQAKSYRGISYS